MPSSTALLVIDLQRGAFDGVRCPPIDSPEPLLRHAGELLAAAREGGHPVFFIHHCEDEAESPFQQGSAHWPMHESLAPAAGEAMLNKRVSSAFDDTDLGARLDALGVQQIVVCGLQSEFCVSNTTRSALQRGLRVQVAEDAHGTWPSDGRSAAEIRAEANERLAAAGASLAPTERLAAELRGAGGAR